MGNNDKNVKKNDKMAIATKYGFGSQLSGGNVLCTPHLHCIQGELSLA